MNSHPTDEGNGTRLKVGFLLQPHAWFGFGNLDSARAELISAGAQTSARISWMVWTASSHGRVPWGIWLRPPGMALGLLVYVALANIEAVLQRAAELGSRVVTGKTRQGRACRAYIIDASESLLGLWAEEDVGEPKSPRS